MSLEIIPVWNQMTPELEVEMAEFWIRNKAMLDASIAAERAKQVVCLARSEQGEIVGVSSAHPRIMPLLRQPMYYYRNFIAEEFRGRHLAIPFLCKSKAVLQAYSLALPQPLCIGVIIELENKRLEAHYDQAYWPRTGFTFMGYSRNGSQLRVSYFDGVRLYPPAPLKKPAARKRA